MYVWWGKLRSPNRQAPLPHLDEILALDDAIADESRDLELHLYLTDYRSLYVAHLGGVTVEDMRLVDAEEKLTQALRDGGDPWMASHTSFTNGLLNEVQGRLGAIAIACANGEVTVGAEGASRRYALPRAEPVRSPTGHVQVVISHNGISFQQYVDVRAGQTARVTTCGAGG